MRESVATEIGVDPELPRNRAVGDRDYQNDQDSFAGFEEHDAFDRLVSAGINDVRPTALRAEPPRGQA